MTSDVPSHPQFADQNENHPRQNPIVSPHGSILEIVGETKRIRRFQLRPPSLKTKPPAGHISLCPKIAQVRAQAMPARAPIQRKTTTRPCPIVRARAHPKPEKGTFPSTPYHLSHPSRSVIRRPLPIPHSALPPFPPDHSTFCRFIVLSLLALINLTVSETRNFVILPRFVDQPTCLHVGKLVLPKDLPNRRGITIM